MWIKVFIIIIFLGILISLASGLYHLVNNKGSSEKTVRALTIRVGLSLTLFLVLMILVGLGVIKPHGVYPTPPPAEAQQSSQ